MTNLVLQRADQFWRNVVPLLVTLACIVMGAVNWPLPWLGMVTPPVALMAIYYWSIYRPDVFTPVTAFGAGVLVDALGGMPLGLSAICFLAVQRLTVSQRNLFVSHSFMILWIGFAASAVIVMLLQWVGLSVIHRAVMPLVAAMAQTLLAVVLFPLLAAAMIWVQRRIAAVG